MAFNSRCLSRQVRALGQVLAHQPLVFLLVPRCQGLCGSVKKMWIASRWATARARPSLSPDHRSVFSQQRGHVTEFIREDLSGTPLVRPVHLCQEDQARRPLDQGADG